MIENESVDAPERNRGNVRGSETTGGISATSLERRNPEGLRLLGDERRINEKEAIRW